MFESQFFGYRKGAFTGAIHDETGYFDQAHGGILFLDEILGWFMEYDRPGNVREPANEVRRYAIMDEVELQSPWSEETGPEQFSPCQPFNKQIVAFECRVIGTLLEGVKGNRAMASKLLKIPLPTPIYHICLCHLHLPDEESVRQNGLIYIESYFAAGCVIYSISARPG